MHCTCIPYNYLVELLEREVKQFHGHSHSAVHPVVDGESELNDISEVFRSKLSATLNKHDARPFDPLTLGLAGEDLHCCFVSLEVEVVQEAFEHLKWDNSTLHFLLAASVLSDPLAVFFTALLRHGFLHCPQWLIDCACVVPVQKSGKNPSSSDSYRPIALASALSKLLDLILIQFSSCLKLLIAIKWRWMLLGASLCYVGALAYAVVLLLQLIN